MCLSQLKKNLTQNRNSKVISHSSDYKLRKRPVRSDLLHDLPDLRLKAHVEHSVGLIQHQVGAATEVSLAHLKHNRILFIYISAISSASQHLSSKQKFGD